MITSTLFDIVAITDLRPTWDTFYPTLETTTGVDFRFDRDGFKNYIVDHQDKNTKEVSEM